MLFILRLLLLLLVQEKMKHLAEMQQEESKLRAEQEQLRSQFDRERKREVGGRASGVRVWVLLWAHGVSACEDASV